MPRKKFYSIGKPIYLFPAQSQPNGERENPEEPVRQWCAYELVRAYGICITDIEFERQVRVGSKFYRIDILVLRNGKPWLVVECKEPNHSKPEDGMAQAISYAGAQEIQAEFAIYTNGSVWKAQRYYREQWIPVPDIPIPVDDQAQQPIGYLLQTLHDVAPLLYCLHKPLEGKEAKRFFVKMQQFFHGWNSLTWEGGSKELHFGVELVLRVLSVDKSDDHYCHSKLEGARASFERFREQAGFPVPIYPLDGPHLLSAKMRDFHNALSGMIDGTREIQAYDSYLLRLSVALLEYGQLWTGSKHRPPRSFILRLWNCLRPERDLYPPVGANLHNTLQDFLSYVLAVRLNISLPDALDDFSRSDMKSYCELAWNEDEKEI